MISRSKLCTFAALAFAFGSNRGLRIDEAAYVLTDLLVDADIMIYDGLVSGLPRPVRNHGDENAAHDDHEWDRNDYIADYGFNSHWWDERLQENVYKAFAFLIDKSTAMLLFDLNEIPVVDQYSFHGIHARVGQDSLNPPKSPEPLIESKTTHTPNHNKSTKLLALDQASLKFWSNADRDDRATHPDNKDVIRWLIERGFSETLADKAATIIRPEWAGTGRKPDK